MKKLLFILLMLPFIGFTQDLIKVDRDGRLTKDIHKADGYIPKDFPSGLYSGAMQISTPEEAQQDIYNRLMNLELNSGFFREWDKYLTDCNELVADTIYQSGTVKCELVPVKMNGKIVSYNTVPIDTTWNKCDCFEYKHIYSNNILTISTSDNIVLTGSVGIGYLEPEPAKNTFTIQRKKICMVKKRKAAFEDFFSRWCVEKKLILFN